MTYRTDELEAAARNINPASLQAAKSAVAACCAEYISWADLFSNRLESIEPSELHKFARALSLTMLGHLPTRPGTCPFCIQYGIDRSCRGCGYALIHGRCDSDDSAFSRFIEAFQDLGKAIYQDHDTGTGELRCDPAYARNKLMKAINSSVELAERMQQDLPQASALRLMELKACYLDEMMERIPEDLLSAEAREKLRAARDTLKNYW